jgi:hypothetical protein
MWYNRYQEDGNMLIEVEMDGPINAVESASVRELELNEKGNRFVYRDDFEPMHETAVLAKIHGDLLRQYSKLRKVELINEKYRIYHLTYA